MKKKPRYLSNYVESWHQGVVLTSFYIMPEEGAGALRVACACGINLL